MDELTELRNYLKDVPSGPVAPSFVQDIESLLSKAWPSLKIVTDDANLQPYKLLRRTEDLKWNLQLLTFNIERHGALVLGSTRAEVYSWEVDLDKKTATMGPARQRQIIPADKRLDVQPIAKEIAALILGGKTDGRLKWQSDSKVRVLINAIIPETVKQTTSDRRKRFRSALDALLTPHGWAQTSSYRYERRAMSHISE